MNDIVISDVAIRTDAAGRFCLNDLHRASGGESKHQPSNWLRMQQTQDLMAELTRSSEMRNEQNQTLSVLQGGNGPQGTFVAKELVYAYAMWISPAFHLKVIRAYDQLVSAPVHLVPQSLPEALRLAADLAEGKAKAEAALAVAEPKAQRLDRIAAADGAMCITNAAKALQVRPKDLFAWMRQQQWIYRRAGGAGWVAYQHRIEQGVLESKVITFVRSNGSERVVDSIRVTAKGLTVLAGSVPTPSGQVLLA